MIRWLKDNRGFVVFLLCFGVFRTAVADWNPIPSGSMRPTLLEGDVVLVDRLAYDLKVPLAGHVIRHLADPQRGDVVTFASPKDGSRLIKRIVAVGGDTVEVRGNVLVVNGEAARYRDPERLREFVARGVDVAALRTTEQVAGSERRVQFLAVGAHRDFGSAVVPDGQVFVLGDNRDNSEDSRYIGFVSRDAIIGRAHRVLVSADIGGHWLPRLDRTASAIR